MNHSKFLCAAAAAFATTVLADTTITTFDDFTPNARYASWASATVLSTPSNYIVSASGYGSCWKQLGPPPVNALGETNILLDITLGGGPGASNNLGVIIDLKDGDGTQISYRWYGRSPGHHLLTGNLFDSAVPATDNGAVIEGNAFRIVTNSVGTVEGLDLSTLWHLNMEFDPYVYSGTYSAAWNELTLTSGAGVADTNICAVISSFDTMTMNGLYGNWLDQVSTSTNLEITATGWGGAWSFLSPQVAVASDKALQLDLRLTAPGAGHALGPIVVLEDADGTQLTYSWYGQTPGNHILAKPLANGATVPGHEGTVPGFDFSQIAAFHLQLDPSSFGESYTVAWNDLSVIGCIPPRIEITGFTFDQALRQYTLVWTSEPGAVYTVETAPEISDTFTTLVADVPSGGVSTSIGFNAVEPNRSFFRIRKQ